MAKKTSEFTGVPAGTYIAKLVAGQHDGATLFAAFDNHKNGDFKPYLLKSADAGKTWKSIAGNLPERGTVYCVAEDHANPDLLFCGTEFGLFATVDGGKKWHRMTNGLPTIQVKDLVIQKHNNDLVVGTFGRGIYVLDDYSPLRALTAEAMEKPAHATSIRRVCRSSIRDSCSSPRSATSSNSSSGIVLHKKKESRDAKARSLMR